MIRPPDTAAPDTEAAPFTESVPSSLNSYAQDVGLTLEGRQVKLGAPDCCSAGRLCSVHLCVPVLGEVIAEAIPTMVCVSYGTLSIPIWLPGRCRCRRRPSSWARHLQRMRSFCARSAAAVQRLETWSGPVAGCSPSSSMSRAGAISVYPKDRLDNTRTGYAGNCGGLCSTRG